MRPVVIAAVSLALLAAVPTPAQDKKSRYRIPDIDKKDVSFGTQRLDGQDALVVTVRFKLLREDGQPATEQDLEENKDTVVVREEGEIVEVLDLTVPKAGGLSVVLVVDCSGSMSAKASTEDDKSKMEALHEAAVNFIRKMPDQTKASLLPFSSAVESPRPFTSDKTD